MNVCFRPLVLNSKGKGRRWLSIYALRVGKLSAETLDGDRENWLPGCISDIRSENTVLKQWSRTKKESTQRLYFFANPLDFFWILTNHASHVFFSLVQKFGKLNFTCSESCFLPLHRINLIIHFSQIKCAQCSHLRTSCKSLWLVYTPVYSSCRVLSPVLARWRRAITPFKELFSWKLPRVYADYFPQST